MTMIYAAASIKAMLRDAANDLAEAIEERKPWHVIYEAMCRVERLAVDLRLERRDSSAHT